ncbi:hypothetical protein F5Y05DRAFT_420715 [Hypoxylon sp. FL0543]|nr:hypothetical protein F5Y05DRAFT_420715 [Hypoxylon sp. FL0543]
MRVTSALLGLVGAASAANTTKVPTSFADLSNGSKSTPLQQPPYQSHSTKRRRRFFPSTTLTLIPPVYTIPLVNNAMDFASAVRDDYLLIPPTINTTTTNTKITTTTIAPRRLPGRCVPQLPTRTTDCRRRRIDREDYAAALAKFVDWIETGPDAGWLPPKSCKALVHGKVAVAACSSGGPNPTCAPELLEAMRELDLYCPAAPASSGGDIRIRRWRKTYGRHNLLDGDNGPREPGADELPLDAAEVEAEADVPAQK